MIRPEKFESMSDTNMNLVMKGGLWLIQTWMSIYDLITFPIYYIIQKPWLRLEQGRCIRSRGTVESASSVLFVPEQVRCRELEALENSKVTTMNECLDLMVEQYSHQNMVATRAVLGEEEQWDASTGNVMTKLDLGDYTWKSYVQVNQSAGHLGKGLRELGLHPFSNVCIFGETREEWLLCAMACFKQNLPLVTLYANLTEDAVAHGINETQATHIFTTHQLLPKFREILKKTPHLSTVIYMKNSFQSVDLHNYRSDVKLISLEELIDLGSKSTIMDRKLPQAEDAAIIMYTSGSTGMPKGVVLPHRAMVATIKAFHAVVDGRVGDIYLAYLPMAHVFELLSEMTLLMQGVAIGYSSPHTMTDNSTKIKEGQLGDCSLLKPTIMCAVPLVIDRLYKGIQEKVKSKGIFFQKLVHMLLVYKSLNLQRGYTTPIVDGLIFRKMRQVVGGHIRFLISGGAPLTNETHDFVRLAFSVPLVQGYGLTETCACACVMSRQELTTGRNGPPMQGVKIRLIDWPEGNYTVKDKPRPRGEVVVGGDTIATGYYRVDDEVSKDFFTDPEGTRWFITGDIGEMYEDGTLKIIDRKKDLVKLSYGEYVSLGKVEAVFKTCSLVDMICICADSTKDHCVALVVPDFSKLKLLATQHLGIEDSDVISLCSNPIVVETYLRELRTYGFKAGLNKFEVPANLILLSEPWTPESGLVTPAFKLKRKPILQRFSKELEHLYAVECTAFPLIGILP